MASTTTKILIKKISLSHGTTKGGGGPDPFVVKDYKKGLFLLMPSLMNLLILKANSPSASQSLLVSSVITAKVDEIKASEIFSMVFVTPTYHSPYIEY